MDPTELKEFKEAVDKVGTGFEEFKKTIAEQKEEIKKQGEESAETKQKLARIDEELEKWSETKNRINQIEAAVNRGGGSDRKGDEVAPEVKEYKNALFRAYLTKGAGEEHLADLHAKAAAVCPEMKSLRSNSNPDGGYWVTADTSGATVQKVHETSPIRPYASVQAISTDALEGTTDYDRAGAAWEEDETSSPSETDTPQVGKYRIPVHTMRALPRISQKLLEDANLDAEAWLMDKVSTEFVLTENEAFVNGNGVGKPRGFLTYAAGTSLTDQQVEQVTTAASGVLNDVDIMDLIYSLKAAYRLNAAFATSRLGIRTVRKIQDDQGAFVWQPGLIAGEPDRLAGFPVLEMNDIPDPTNGALSMVFADWARFYQIVDRIGMSVLRDPYSAKPMIEFLVRRRVGGAVANFEAGKILKVKA